MVALDTSILAYAVNRFAPQHARAARVVETNVNGELPWALPSSVAHEFLRVTTHPHAVARPLEPGDAVAFLRRMLDSQAAHFLAPTERHLGLLAELLDPSNHGPGSPPGIETAVLLREHGVREILTCDRGMSRFRFLVVIDPIHGEPWSPGAVPKRRYRVLHPRATR